MHYGEWLAHQGFKCTNIARANYLLGLQRRDVIQVVKNLNLDIEEELLQTSPILGGMGGKTMVMEILFAEGHLELV